MGVQNAFSGLIFILFETVPRLRRVDFDAPARGTQVLLLQDLSCSEVSCEPFQRCPTVPRCTPMRFRKVLIYYPGVTHMNISDYFHEKA